MFRLILVQIVHYFVSLQDWHAAVGLIRDTSLSVMLWSELKQLGLISVDIPAYECFETHG
jgi:hypothetical protein